MEWYQTLKTWLTSKEIGFVPGYNEPCAFMHPTTGLKIAVVVDDILCRGSPEATAEFYKALGERFDCKDPAYLSDSSPIKYVGFDICMKYVKCEPYIYITQQHDLLNYLEDIGVGDVKMLSNPMPNKYAILNDPTPLGEEESHKYRSIVGALNFYSGATRYDISYPVSRLSQFCKRPTVGSMQALYKVLAYMKCTSDFSISAKYGGRLNAVECYCDSDHAGNKLLNTRSQTGIIILLNGAPVYWRSVKQVSTAISSACAEIYALSDAAKHARLYRWRGEELGMHNHGPVVVQVDNLQAKSFAEGTCVDSKLRGTFDIRAGWVQELRDAAELRVDHVMSVNNVADLLTKVHKTSRYKQLIAMIGEKCFARNHRSSGTAFLAKYVGG